MTSHAHTDLGTTTMTGSTLPAPVRPQQPRRIIYLAGEAVEVTRLAPAPVLQRVTAHDEEGLAGALREVALAGRLPGTPPESYGRALARAITDEPLVAVARINNGIVTDPTDSSDIAAMRTSFSPYTVLPGDQPRGGSAGGRPGQVREPAEGFDVGASGLGLRVLVFDDVEHLRAWVADALARSLTRALKRGRPQEIAATGVRRPVSAHMALLQFADGTASQWVPMLSDGISRLAVCAASLLGDLDEDPAVTAAAVAHRMLPTSTLTASSTAHELARCMRRNHQTFLTDYQRHLVDDGPDEHGATIQQFLTLPATLHLLAADPTTGAPCPMEPAMESIVSDLHTGVDGWVLEDNSRYSTIRALKLLLQSGDLGSDLFDLCANRADLATSPLLQPTPVFGPRPLHSTPVDMNRLLLRRAVVVMAALMGPSTYPAVKSALRDTTDRKKLRMQHVIEYLAPLVCEPWGTSKPITRAWAWGGPAPTWLPDVQLIPAHPDDYLVLVEHATNPSSSPESVLSARLELALAGGTALIADGILTTALVGGSGGASTPLAYSGPVNGAIDALTRTEEGLTSLAIAANHFQPDRSATAARLPAIDLDRPDKVARDGMGMPVRTTERILASYAAQAEPIDTTHPTESAATDPTPLQNLQARAARLPSEAMALLRGIELTKALYDETGGPTGLSEHDLDTVHDSVAVALRLVGRLR